MEIILVIIAVIFVMWLVATSGSTKANNEKEAFAEFNAEYQRHVDAISDESLKIFPVTPAVRIPQKDTAVISIPAARFGYRSAGYAYHGPRARVKIMKGIYYNAGAGKAARTKEFVQIDAGQFVVTDNRFIFSGEDRGITINFTQVTGVNYTPDLTNPSAGGIAIKRSNGSTEYISFELTSLLAAKIGAMVQGFDVDEPEPDNDQYEHEGNIVFID